MSIRISHVIAVCGALTLSGCADFTHYNVVRTIGSPGNTAGGTQARGTATYIDAKQRVVLAVPLVTRTIVRDPQGRPTETTTSTMAYCSEPSPDALSALAASGNLSADVQAKVSVAAGFAFSESASAFGLRTQSIQLMRDAMFRLCEGVASGRLSSMQFETLQRRFQSSMVAILAIEQLTGAMRGPQVALGGSARQGSSDLIAERIDKVVAARKTYFDAVAALDKATAEAAAAEGAQSAYLKDKDKEKLTDAQKAELKPLTDKATSTATAKTAATAAAGRSKEDYENQQAALAAVQSGGSSATSTATATAAGAARELDGAAATALANAVQAIVKDTNGLGFLRELCTSVLVAGAEGRGASAAILFPVGVPDSGVKPDVGVVRAADGGVGQLCLEYSWQTVNALSATTQLRRLAAGTIAGRVARGEQIGLDELKLLYQLVPDGSAAPTDTPTTEPNMMISPATKPAATTSSAAGASVTAGLSIGDAFMSRKIEALSLENLLLKKREADRRRTKKR